MCMYSHVSALRYNFMSSCNTYSLIHVGALVVQPDNYVTSNTILKAFEPMESRLERVFNGTR